MTTKSTPERYITLRAAESVSCDSFYQGAIRNLGTGSVRVYAQAGELRGQQFLSRNERKLLPLTSESIASVIGTGWPEIAITIEYAYGKTKQFHGEARLMTNAAWLIQTLDLWESMLGQLETYTEDGKKAHAKLSDAIELLKSTYSVAELLPIDLPFEDFKNLFDVPAIPDATSDSRPLEDA